MRTAKSSRFIVNDSQLTIIGHFTRTSAPTEDQGGFTKYLPYTSIHIACGGSNRHYLLHHIMKLSMLRMLRGVYCSGPGSISRLYINESNMITNMITDVMCLLTVIFQDSGRAIADFAAAQIGKYNNP